MAFRCMKCNQPVTPGRPGIGERVRKGSTIYYHRICSRRLKTPKRRTYQLDAPRKLGWDRARQCALTSYSEISGVPFRKDQPRIIDHLWPERLGLVSGKDPHARVNLICLTGLEHGQKRRAEDKLLKAGDLLSYLSALNILGWPMERVHAALEFYGVKVPNVRKQNQEKPHNARNPRNESGSH